jgi:thiopeptide-type bacteriocin biosynthesis protein
VARVQFDTYQPEVTRYGGATGVLLAEQIFHADSRAALALLHALHGESDQGRMHACLLSIDLLLESLGFGPVERLVLMEDMRKRFAVVGVPNHEAREVRERVGANFRQQRAAIEALLSSQASPSPRIQSAIAYLRRRSGELVPSVERLSTLIRTGDITERFEELAISYVHLLVNRMFRNASGFVEFAIYDTLARHYRSAVAKARAPVLTA